MVLGIFKIAPSFREQHVFMWHSVEILNVFNTLTLKQIFWKTKTLFKKLEYHFLLESTKIESTSFPYKTAISEANVKINRMLATKWTYRKERSFASNYFMFLKICFSLRICYRELVLCTNNPNAHIHTFCKFHRKTPVLESLFNKAAGFNTGVFLWDFADFLQNTSGGCFWKGSVTE